MLRLTELKLPLDHAADALRPALCQRLGIADGELIDFTIFKRSYDARKKSAITLIYTLDFNVRDEPALLRKLADDRNVGPRPNTDYKFVAQAPADLKTRPVVIGTGPCGLLAGLILAQMGFKPIILERGKAVRERTKDTWGLWRNNKLNPESNVQFGPQHHGRKVLEEFVKAGAPEEIMYVSKPHIGTFRLVKMVENIRATITDLGGEIRFGSKVERLVIDDHQVRGVVMADGQTIATDHVVLAVGHSARDTFQALYEQGVFIEAKPFSIGFRIEHPQAMIDKARFGPNAGNEILGAADYKLVHHCGNGRAAYSFCMCPGGQVVAATSEEGRVVTNGMSQYSRAERNANAALVVEVKPEDFPGDYRTNPLAGIEYQRQWESAAFVAGGSNYAAPAQRVGDFLTGRPSTALGEVDPSYQPGVHMTDLASCAPAYVIDALREAIPAFDKQIRGFAMADAILTGVETRTSSPIRIKRGADYQSINTRGLYPAGEGAGYAGGILSAGVDGIKVAEAVAISIAEQR
ncbi:MAG: FAD dependent oxidoreductase [Rhodocyclaceae bacterium]|nr:MAG: FAD dependent oxidoreductase [Rhodocyclaceae bacterium]